jgi:hypothetical protein
METAAWIGATITVGLGIVSGAIGALALTYPQDNMGGLFCVSISGFLLALTVTTALFAGADEPRRYPPPRPPQFRYPPGHCQSCGYFLRGNESGRCPECGHFCTLTHVRRANQRQLG